MNLYLVEYTIGTRYYKAYVLAETGNNAYDIINNDFGKQVIYKTTLIYSNFTRGVISVERDYNAEQINNR